MSLFLMTSLFYKALILHGEIGCWSLLGLKGLNSIVKNSVRILLINQPWLSLNIKEVAKAVNQSLMRLITEDDDKDFDSDSVAMDCDNAVVEPQTQLDVGPVVDVLTLYMTHKSIQTRIAVLRWVLLLHVKTPNKVS